jgi:predicted TIM-barrel fold metal-dependent hydrolase
VHAGIWGDFRDIDCTHMLTLAPAHPRTDFDLYHLGMPSVREAIVVAKNLPNVWLNLCWTHIISQVQTRSGIDEMLDQVPVNKVLAFGGDYARPVEKVVGHLYMAREDYARILGERVDRGLMDLSEARHILRLWFRENPLKLYRRLKLPREAT